MPEEDDKLPPLVLEPRAAALVIVDMQNDFCSPAGKVYLGAHVRHVVEAIARLLRRCRDVALPVLYTWSLRLPDDPSFRRFGCRPYVLEGSWGAAFVPELQPRPGEAIVPKYTHDCFYATAMDEVLRQREISPESHQIMVTGVGTSVCVYHAVLGFHVRHYRVVVPMDCTAGGPNADLLVSAQLSSPAYSYNVTLTTSERLVLLPAAPDAPGRRT